MIIHWAEQFTAAWRFLTIIPLGKDGEAAPEELGASMAMFPLVGLVLGAVLVLLEQLFASMFPRMLADLMVIALLVVLTGGLHMDGFADVMDGIAGGSDRKEILGIMRDSRIGAAGVTGLVFLILFKVVSFNQSPEGLKPGLLLCMPGVGRWTMLQLACFSGYARKGKGTGKAFVDYSGRREYGVGLFVVSMAVLFSLGAGGLFILCFLGSAAYLLMRYFNTKIGGVTGDVLGFAGEFNEALFLLMGAAFL